jgi:hypothetical protein
VLSKSKWFSKKINFILSLDSFLQMQETKEKEHEERNCEKIDVCRKVSLKMRNGIFLGAGKRSGIKEKYASPLCFNYC